MTKVEQLISIANEDKDAAFELAASYSTGINDVGVDEEKAFYWCKKAADLGHKQATFNLAAMYHDGVGTEKDLILSLKFLEAAAEEEVPQALFMLGVCYENGELVDKDLIRAEQLYEKAVLFNHPIAKYKIAKLILNNKERKEHEYIRAKTMLESSASNGNPLAMYELINLLKEENIDHKQDKNIEILEKALSTISNSLK